MAYNSKYCRNFEEFITILVHKGSHNRPPCGGPIVSHCSCSSVASAWICVGATRQDVFGSGKSPTGRPQRPRSTSKSPKPQATSLFTPFENIPALSFTNYARFTPSSPRHTGIRIKEPTFCDGSYTGYIDVNARHLFSRRNPAKDDVIFWIDGGGPGCSSAMGSWVRAGSSRTVERSSSNIARSRGTSSLLINLSMLGFRTWTTGSEL